MATLTKTPLKKQKIQGSPRVLVVFVADEWRSPSTSSPHTRRRCTPRLLLEANTLPDKETSKIFIGTMSSMPKIT
jgi:hypothetical protein